MKGEKDSVFFDPLSMEAFFLKDSKYFLINPQKAILTNLETEQAIQFPH